jgi:hypothetical protein
MADVHVATPAHQLISQNVFDLDEKRILLPFKKQCDDDDESVELMSDYCSKDLAPDISCALSVGKWLDLSGSDIGVVPRSIGSSRMEDDRKVSGDYSVCGLLANISSSQPQL